MKRNVLKNKIQDGFSELSPDIFETVMKSAFSEDTCSSNSIKRFGAGADGCHTTRFSLDKRNS